MVIAFALDMVTFALRHVNMVTLVAQMEAAPLQVALGVIVLWLLFRVCQSLMFFSSWVQ